MRAFVALEIPEPARARVAGATAPLRESLASVRWVAPENLHLTLRFLGPASPARLERLAPSLSAAAAACPACAARFSGLGSFPERGSPRVLWLGLEAPPAILGLQSACERAAVAAGFPPETRPFRCHLTLGRFRERAPRPELPALELGEARLSRLLLLRSELRPQGPLYSVLAAFPLAG